MAGYNRDESDEEVFKKRKREKKDKDMSKINTFTCTIPGLKNPMNITFPAGKLSVCEKCKKIFKTRELCRERDGHTGKPWKKTYICFTVDDSCLEVDSTTGDMRVVKEDGPNPHTFVASIVETSTTKYYAQFDSVKGRLDPICAPCKVKNYTKNHCRVKHGHKHLPWGTVYMSLKAVKSDQKIDLKTGSKRPQDRTLDSNSIKRIKSEDSCVSSNSVRGSTDESPSTVASLGVSSGESRGVPLGTSSNSRKSFLYDDRNGSEAFLLTLSAEICELQWLKTSIDSENKDPNSVAELGCSHKVDTKSSKTEIASSSGALLPVEKHPFSRPYSYPSYSHHDPHFHPHHHPHNHPYGDNEFNPQSRNIESSPSFDSIHQNGIPASYHHPSFDCGSMTYLHQGQDPGSYQMDNYSHCSSIRNNNSNSNCSNDDRNHNYDFSSSQPIMNHPAEYDCYPPQSQYSPHQSYHTMMYPNGGNGTTTHYVDDPYALQQEQEFYNSHGNQYSSMYNNNNHNNSSNFINDSNTIHSQQNHGQSVETTNSGSSSSMLYYPKAHHHHPHNDDNHDYHHHHLQPVSPSSMSPW